MQKEKKIHMIDENYLKGGILKDLLGEGDIKRCKIRHFLYYFGNLYSSILINGISLN